jgi:hypothetical protein
LQRKPGQWVRASIKSLRVKSENHWKQKGQKGQKRQKLFASFALFALFASSNLKSMKQIFIGQA